MRQEAKWRQRGRHWFVRTNSRYGWGLWKSRWRSYARVVVDLGLSVLIVYVAGLLFSAGGVTFPVKKWGRLTVDGVNFALCGSVGLVSFLLLARTLIRREQIFSDPQGVNQRVYRAVFGSPRPRRSFWQVMMDERQKLQRMLLIQLVATLVVLVTDAVFHERGTEFAKLPIIDQDSRSFWLCASVAGATLAMTLIETYYARWQWLRPWARKRRRRLRYCAYLRWKWEAEKQEMRAKLEAAKAALKLARRREKKKRWRKRKRSRGS